MSKQRAGWQESRLVSLQVQEIFLVSVAARLALKLAESRIQQLPASPPVKEKRLVLKANLHPGAKLRTRGAIPGVHKFSKNLGSHLKILGVRRVTCGKSHTKRPQILRANVQNLVSRVARVLCTPEPYFHSPICLHVAVFNYVKGQLHICTLKKHCQN